MTQDISRKKNPWFFGILIVAILFGSVMLSRYLMNSAPVAERKAPARVARLVSATPLERASERVKIAAYGEVEAAQDSTLAPRVGGEVIEVSRDFVPGNRVAKGTLLLRVDPTDYELAVVEAEASLATARASLAQEQGNQVVARADAALLDLDVSDEEQALMLREPQLKSAQASVKLAEMDLQQARLNLERTRIVAPFDGVVLSRDVSLGDQVVANSSTLGQMAAGSPYWVVLRVPVSSLRWIEWPDEQGRGGSKVELTDTGDTHSPVWQGRVIQLLDQLEEEGRRAGVLVEVTNPHAGTRPLLLGSFVKATIHGQELVDALRLDNTWVHDGQVWKVVQGRLQLQPLDVAFSASDHILVTQGLDVDDMVVTSVPSGFVDGMSVRIQGQEETTARPQRPAQSDRQGPRQ